LKSNILIKTIILTLIFSKSSFAFNECNKVVNNSSKNIKFLEIVINGERKLLTELGRKLIKFEQIKKAMEIGGYTKALSKYKNFEKKKRYKSKVVVNYLDGTKCSFKSKIRAHGDNSDHIDLIHGVPVSSLRVNLEEGNIKNVTKFILLRPKSRNSDNEIFISTLLSHLGFLSPKSFYINVKIHGKIIKYIFQENLKKEFLENNKRVEGPIIEQNEDSLLKRQSANSFILQMSRVTNKEWIKSEKSNLLTTIEAIKKFNKILMYSYNYFFNHSEVQEILRSNKNSYSSEEYKINSTFESFMFALDSLHGMAHNNRRYYYDPIYSTMEPIYYDGMSKILSIIGYNIKNEKYEVQLDKNIITRNVSERFLTLSAVNGANHAIENLNKLNKKNLIIELKKNGLKKIDKKKIDILFDFIIKRLNLIKNVKISAYNEPTKEEFFTKYSKYMRGLDDETYLVFLNSILDNKDIYLYNIEICTYELKKCEIETIDAHKLNYLLEQEKYNEKYAIFMALSKIDYVNGDLEIKRNIFGKNFDFIELNEKVKIAYTNDIELNFNEENRTLNINFLNNNARIIIYKSALNDLNINMKNLSRNNKNFSKKNSGLTGCLTIVDSKIKNLNFVAHNFNCEDTLNLIRSEGNINNIKINNSFSDAIDSDFSKLDIDNISIDGAGNDCSDFSFGKYIVKQAEFKNCTDKAISVGENSEMNIENLIVSNSNIGLASKDSSKTKILNSKINNVNECYAAYNKKQEFDGGSIIVNNSACLNFINKDIIDKYSLIQIKNEQL
jgi:hypothetical protein